MSASLPVLENLRVASPCTESWDAMTGDDRARHCASCDKDVFNLSGMTSEDALAFVRTHLGGDVCVRFYKRRDGTVLTSDCPVGLAAARRRMFLAVAAVCSFLGLTAVAAAAAGTASQCDLDGDSAFSSSPTVQAVVAMFSGKPVAPPVNVVRMGKMVYRPPAAAAATTPAPVAGSGNSTGSNP